MNLLLRRFQRTDQSTIGRLYLDDQVVCYTLEDAVRDEKIYGQTAIPAGTYQIVLYDSPKCGFQVPLLLDVPNYQFVEIHPGNTAADTEGCILVGTSYGDDVVNNSRAAFALLFNNIATAIESNDQVWITVE